MIHKNTVPALLIAACAAAISSLPSPAHAGNNYDGGGQVSGVAEREIARRQDRATQADAAIQAGDELMENDQYDQAAAQYKLAVDLLPDSLATGSARSKALAKFSRASIKLAEQRINEGRFADAQAVIARVVEYDPENDSAKTMLKHLGEPDYYNKTVGPKFVANVEQVKKLLGEAEGYYDSGRYDMSVKRCEQVLNIDPYNVAARRMEEKITKAKTQYSHAAYDQARGQAIWEVDSKWERPITKYGLGSAVIVQSPSDDLRGTASITAKLNKIIIPRIEFKDATIREAIDYLKAKSRDIDDDPNPEKRGVNIVLKLESSYRTPSSPAAAAAAPVIPGLETPAASVDATAAAPSAEPGSTPITLSLTNVPLIEALRYITSLANLKFKIEPYAVSVVPLSQPTEDLITKQYQVSPGFISGAAAASGEAAAAPAAGTADAAGTGNAIAKKQGAREYLEGQGVPFPPGASATYQAGSSRLIVKNTQEALDLIDTLVSIDSENAPKQVEIESKFVEITQNNSKELSFDWLLGQFDLSSSNGIVGSGGTQGTAPSLDNGDYPFVRNGSPVGTNPITGGNRSGGTAISANAIDALLFGLSGNSLRAPAAFGIAGIFTDPQFQLVIRALDQKKGVDLLSSPRVTTKSGMRAVIEIIREFRYPTEFDPPQIPQTVGSTTVTGTGVGTGGGSSGGGAFPVTPTTPTSFETRNTGVTLEVEPQVGPDGQTIDLTLAPSVTEFEGFINYGSPIQTTSTNLLGVTTTNVLTANVINQPIFSTRKVTTQVSIWDGQTVVVGGLIREDVQKVEDKTPLLGDIPILGRLFRSNVDQHIKRNLVVFVTARLMNPAGQPILNAELEEETVEPLPLTELNPPAQPLPNYAK
ncbi:MAG: Amuc_1098 family type IV pilus outer membrane protein [Chthoniobacterales bacterium]